MKKLLISTILVLFLTNSAWAFDYNNATKLYDNGEFKELEQLCQTELKENNNSLDALYFLASLNFSKNKIKEGEVFMLQFIKAHNEYEIEMAKERKVPLVHYIDSHFISLYYTIGEYYFHKNKDYREALKWFKYASSQITQDSMLHFYLGVCYLETQDYNKARKHFETELKIKPTEPSPYYNIACTYAMEKNKDEAVKWLGKAIKNYKQFKEMAKTDKNFDSIKNTKEFKELIN